MPLVHIISVVATLSDAMKAVYLKPNNGKKGRPPIRERHVAVKPRYPEESLSSRLALRDEINQS